MKINHLISGILLTAVFFMCGASFASTYTGTSILPTAPTNTVMVYEVEPPLVPAVQPGNDGIDSGEGRRISITYFQLKITDNKIPYTVLACGYESKVIPIPTRIPITI